MSAAIAARLEGYERVLLFGPPGIGKSTLAAELAAVSAAWNRPYACLSADPGSPAFGVPGAVSLGRWTTEGWVLTDLEPLCTLDAGRFRLPLIQALDRLRKRAASGPLLIDSPGVTRGAAGAELLMGMVESLDVDCVLSIERSGEPADLPDELCALAVPILRIPAAAEARRPGKTIRDRRRTALWDAFLKNALEDEINLNAIPCTGTPPPRDAAPAWIGRQIAILGGHDAVAFGEVLRLEKDIIRVKLCGEHRDARTLLIRDAQRGADKLLHTARPLDLTGSRFSVPPDLTPKGRPMRGRSPVVHAGSANAILVNGIMGDPLLHVRLQHQKRSLLFDLGEAERLPARIAHQVTDVFITHTHIDHIGGFLWLMRSRIGPFPPCRIFGPPGLAENIHGFIHGIHWDRVGERGPRFQIAELHEDKLLRYTIRAGGAGPEFSGSETTDGILFRDDVLQVSAVTLDHRTAVLAFALETMLKPGKLAYATDLADTPENRVRLEALAYGARTLFCEASFCEADAEHAARTGHLTARACGEIAAAASVEQLVPFHFSRRYQSDWERVYMEVKKAAPRVELISCSPV